MELRYLASIGIFQRRPTSAVAAVADLASAASAASGGGAAIGVSGAVGLGGVPSPVAGHDIHADQSCAALTVAAHGARAPGDAEEGAVEPKGTPLNGAATGACLSVLSYNLLAPAFVRPVDKRTGAVQPYAAFEWAEPASEVLDWEARWPRLLEELRASGADIICLQEVQFESPVSAGGDIQLPAWLRSLEREGYEARLPGRSYLEQMAERNLRVLGEAVAIGCAVLFRTQRLEAVGDAVNNPNTLVAVCVRGRKGTPLEALEPTAVFSLHLDAQSEEKRVEQLSRCLGIVRQVGFREAIFAGDMNTELLEGSCVAAFLSATATASSSSSSPPPPPPAPPSDVALARACASALRLGSAEDDGGDEEEDHGMTKASTAGDASALGDGPTPAQLEAWKALWRRAVDTATRQRVLLSRVPTGSTRSSYDHGKTCGPCVTWRIDHILFTPRNLALRSRWATLEADPKGVEAGLPNRTSPSDHYPIAALFDVAPAPRLPPSAETAALARLEALEVKQASERAALQCELDASQPSPPPPPPEAEGGKKQKGGKKSEKPSPEVIAHIQERRRRTRELRELQTKERLKFVEALGDLELDTLERGLSIPAWLDVGSRS